MQLIIVSGISGSGKTICLHLLEDLAFYSLDNLPVSLLPALVNELEPEYDKLAVGIDIRNPEHQLKQLQQTIKQLTSAGHHCRLIFLEARNDVIIRRFQATRRRHPLVDDKTRLSDALHAERQLLQPLTQFVDLSIDTSEMNIHQLRDRLVQQLVDKKQQRLSLLITSFGFKFGIPADVDYLFDVRFLPNPYWEPGLATQTGLDNSVAEFLLNHPETPKAIASIYDFLQQWLPAFEKTRKQFLTIGIGCTGGQHRSVYVSEQLNTDFAANTDYSVTVKHRELSQ